MGHRRVGGENFSRWARAHPLLVPAPPPPRVDAPPPEVVIFLPLSRFSTVAPSRAPFRRVYNVHDRHYNKVYTVRNVHAETWGGGGEILFIKKISFGRSLRARRRRRRRVCGAHDKRYIDIPCFPDRGTMGLGTAGGRVETL